MDAIWFKVTDTRRLFVTPYMGLELLASQYQAISEFNDGEIKDTVIAFFFDDGRFMHSLN